MHQFNSSRLIDGPFSAMSFGHPHDDMREFDEHFKEQSEPSKFKLDKKYLKYDLHAVLSHDWNRFTMDTIPGTEPNDMHQLVVEYRKHPVLRDKKFNPGPSRRSDFKWTNVRGSILETIFRNVVVDPKMFVHLEEAPKQKLVPPVDEALDDLEEISSSVIPTKMIVIPNVVHNQPVRRSTNSNSKSNGNVLNKAKKKKIGQKYGGFGFLGESNKCKKCFTPIIEDIAEEERLGSPDYGFPRLPSQVKIDSGKQNIKISKKKRAKPAPKNVINKGSVQTPSGNGSPGFGVSTNKDPGDLIARNSPMDNSNNKNCINENPTDSSLPNSFQPIYIVYNRCFNEDPVVNGSTICFVNYAAIQFGNAQVGFRPNMHCEK